MRYGVHWRVAILVLGVACMPAESRDSSRPRASAIHDHAPAESIQLCARPPRGIIVGHDSVAGFSTHAALRTLRQQCGAGKSDLYDAVGWQADAWRFPFPGANVLVVQSNHSGEAMHEDEAPDLWIVEGDSVRLPDGELMPRTLGALRARYGSAIVDDNVGGDDIDGPHARSCRFPYLLFALSVNDTARKLPDSARVTRVDMDTPGADTVISRFCIAHRPEL